MTDLLKILVDVKTDESFYEPIRKTSSDVEWIVILLELFSDFETAKNTVDEMFSKQQHDLYTVLLKSYVDTEFYGGVDEYVDQIDKIIELTTDNKYKSDLILFKSEMGKDDLSTYNWIKRAIELNPHNARAYFKLHLYYSKLGEQQLAKENALLIKKNVTKIYSLHSYDELKNNYQDYFTFENFCNRRLRYTHLLQSSYEYLDSLI